jgi:hypothetical protein
MRILRLARLLRLFKRAKTLKHMLETLVLTLPSLLNTSGLLLLVILIYAMIGVQLFANVQWGSSLDRNANFQTLGNAMLTLIRIFTGEGWEYIVFDAANQAPGCVALDALPYAAKTQLCGYKALTSYSGGPCVAINGCGDPFSAYAFFVSFVLVVSFVFINLLVSVVLAGFEDSEDDSQARLAEGHFRALADRWVEFDPDATLYIAAPDLLLLLQALPEPLGFGRSRAATHAQLQRRIAHLHLPVYAGDRVHFLDVAVALAKRVYVDDCRRTGRGAFTLPRTEEGRMLARVTNKGRPTVFEVSDVFAAQAIQRAFRLRRARALRRAERAHRRSVASATSPTADGLSGSGVGSKTYSDGHRTRHSTDVGRSSPFPTGAAASGADPLNFGPVRRLPARTRLHKP